MKTIIILLAISFGMQYNTLPGERAVQVSGSSGRHISLPAEKGWTESLSKFRDALLKGDRKSVKSYFKFPIRNPGNDIWFVADLRNVMEMDSKDIVPFKETDFDKYFNEVLSIDFRKTLEKLDIKKLAEKKSAETASLKIVSPATSKMKATYSEAKKEIILSLITQSPEFGQFTIDYNFEILPGGDIRFKHVKFNM